jgi:hypothetical protein
MCYTPTWPDRWCLGHSRLPAARACRRHGKLSKYGARLDRMGKVRYSAFSGRYSLDHSCMSRLGNMLTCDKKSFQTNDNSHPSIWSVCTLEDLSCWSLTPT